MRLRRECLPMGLYRVPARATITPMSANPSPLSSLTSPGGGVMPQGEEVASFATYPEAQRAVDALSDQGFPVQQLTDDEGLHVPLSETADVHQSGGDDGTGLDRGDPGQGQEDAAPAGDLDDESDRPRLPAHLQQDDDVMDLAHRIAQGVEDGGTDEAGHKNPAGRARPGVLHKPSLCA